MEDEGNVNPLSYNIELHSITVEIYDFDLKFSCSVNLNFQIYIANSFATSVLQAEDE